jgi:GlpG protein
VLYNNSITTKGDNKLNRSIRITFNSPVILWFAIISFIVLIAGIFTGGASTQAYFMTYHSSLASPWTYVRFFTHVLGHVGWEHYLSNMMYLLLLGPLLEEKYGSRRIIFVILITALATSLANYFLFPSVALCGASGVCFAFILLASFTGFRERTIPLTFILVAIIYLGQQVYQGIFIEDNISNMAHIVGGLVGSIAGYVLNRR